MKNALCRNGFRVFCLLFALATVASSGCDRSGGDEAGGGTRLAVLSPALADTLHALGMGDLIVGRQQFDRFTDQSVPIVGDLTGIDYETMIRIAPTHVVAQQTAGGLPSRLMELAADRGWEVVEVPLLTLEDILDSVSAMAALGPAAAAETGRVISQQLEGGMASDMGLGRTVIVASARPLAVIGPGAFHAQIAQGLGGQPVPTRGAAWVTLDAELFAALDPETIIVLAPGATGAETIEELLGAAGQVSTPALRSGRVIRVSDERCMLPSASILGMIEQIREQAAKLDPVPGR